MNLINRMLQDLDKRSALASSGGPLPPRHVRPLTPARESSRWVRGALGLMIVAALGRVGWMVYELRPAQALVAAFAFQADAMARPEPAAQTAAQTAAVAPVSQQEMLAPECDPQPEESLLKDAPNALPPVDALKLALSIETPIPPDRARRYASPKRPLQAAPELASSAPSLEQASDVPLLPALPAASLAKRDRERTPSEQAAGQFARAMALLSEGRVAEAENGLAAVLQSDPGHGVARQALVALLLEQRRLDDAVPVLQRGLELDPAQVQFAAVLARIQAERLDYASALRTLKALTADTENNADFNNLYGAVLQKLSRHQEAVERYRSALRAAPNNGASWMGLAISLENLAKRGEAAEAYARALATGMLSADARAYAEQKAKELR